MMSQNVVKTMANFVYLFSTYKILHHMVFHLMFPETL